MSGIGQTILQVLAPGGLLDVSGRVESDPRLVAAEQIAARWVTEPGSCFWAPEMGLGLLLLQNADLGPGDLARVEVTARAEAKRVIGVRSATVRATHDRATHTLTLTGRFTLDTGGTFALITDSAGAAEVQFT